MIYFQTPESAIKYSTLPSICINLNIGKNTPTPIISESITSSDRKLRSKMFVYVRPNICALFNIFLSESPRAANIAVI